jgi:hypothetical protein
MAKFGFNYGKHKLEGWQRCIMQVQRSTLTPRIDAKSGQHFAFRRRGERCKVLVSPENIKLYGAAVCASHVPHYVASLESSVAHDRERRARLDPGCEVE